MNKLYAGGPQLRIRQEWILGVGGVRVLRAVGIDPAVWHANEGHAAFMFVERLREQVQGGASFEDAVSAVRARSVFTTHTPVPAGHDFFALDELVSRLPGRCGSRWASTAQPVLRAGRHGRRRTQLPHDGVRPAAGGARQRRVAPARPGLAAPLAQPLARPTLGSGADRPRHQRRAPADLDGWHDPGAARRAPRPPLDRAASRTTRCGTGCSRSTTTSSGGRTCASSRSSATSSARMRGTASRVS